MRKCSFKETLVRGSIAYKGNILRKSERLRGVVVEGNHKATFTHLFFFEENSMPKYCSFYLQHFKTLLQSGQPEKQAFNILLHQVVCFIFRSICEDRYRNSLSLFKEILRKLLL